MQERIYSKGKIASVEELRQHIDGAVKEWQKRLRACAAGEGGQFEREQVYYSWCNSVVATLHSDFVV